MMQGSSLVNLAFGGYVHHVATLKPHELGS